MTTPSITTPVATSKNMSCNINLPWFLHNTEYYPTEATFEPLVNGERAFGAVYDAIMAATKSVEIVCWGFQPSMYFKRGDTSSMCIGKLLAMKAQAGIQVRIEPPRVSRRLQPLRGWSDEKTTEVFPRGP